MSGMKREEIPEQIPIPWLTALRISWAGLRRRLLRSMITTSGVILAIAFLAYMLINEAVTKALVRLGDSELNRILQEKGVDIYAGGKTDEMTLLLIGLALLTCTVGIVNAMLMSVTERVREIGTLKCLGARDLFIVKTYFIESTLQGVLGSTVGMAGGLLVAVAVAIGNYHMHAVSSFPFGATLKALGTALLAGTLISVVAAIAPAYLAARKQPVEALRVEE